MLNPLGYQTGALAGLEDTEVGGLLAGSRRPARFSALS